MRLKIKISKIKNLYSFISNLSQWNELVCVAQRKKEWITRTNPLNNTEKKYLKLFAKILRETDFEIESLFLSEDDKKIWSILNKKMGPEKSKQLKSIFNFFENKFIKIWEKDIKNINLIKTKFNKNKRKIDTNLKIINSLCDLSPTVRLPDITLFLLLSSHKKEESQGRAFDNTIVLECSGWPITKIDYLLNNIFLHEYFHILFKKNKSLFGQFNKIINKNKWLLEKSKLQAWPIKIVIEEALISSFIPEGYLSEVNLKINVLKEAKNELSKNRADELSRLRNFSAFHMYTEAKSYIENKKSLDLKFFTKIISVIKNFTKTKGRINSPLINHTV